MAVSTLGPASCHIGFDNHHFATRQTSPPLQPRPNKRLSPGLSLRLRRLEEQRNRREAIKREQKDIGRIPEEQLEELEGLQRQNTVEIRRRGRAWTGPTETVMPIPGGVRLDGQPLLSEPEGDLSVLESDVSSIISISDRLVASESEEERDPLQDTKKYRMPDIGKTRLNLRTKEPLSPSPRRQTNGSTPTTPRTHSAANDSPTKLGSPRNPRPSSTDTLDGDFIGGGGHSHSRTGSIYTLSRVSFTGQLSQLTSMRLPDANSLAKRISSIPTASDAAKSLTDASEQIHRWIKKASEVLSGLNAEDDVDWAAAGGREGIEEVDNAVHRLERLVEAYILSIDQLQARKDIGDLSSGELNSSVNQMEAIIEDWKKVKDTLRGVKEQVEIALDWERLWNGVLGEAGQEMEALNNIVFEMEEKRHQGADRILHSKDAIDLNELETIVEDKPGTNKAPNKNRFSIPPFSPTTIIPATPMSQDHDDSNLLGLFARMQPMRASLDFLPMQLSSFHIRGKDIFPSACLDLDQRRDQLEEMWKKLEADAESLRRELGEDKWIMVFRNAGRQALKMCESINRSRGKLKESIDSGEYQTNVSAWSKKMENFEAKKLHYGPAIQRVLAIIDRGVLDRLTVNGEILRLQSDMKDRWATLQGKMRDMDVVLEDIVCEAREAQLRESVSTVMSSERSPTSSLHDTPGSSPASSVVGATRESSFQGSRTPTPFTYGKTRNVSNSQTSTPRINLLPPGGSIPRRTPVSHVNDSRVLSSPLSSPSTARSTSTSTTRSTSGNSGRPRFVSVVKPEVRSFPPLSATEPSPYARSPLTPKTNYLRSNVPLRTTPASAPSAYAQYGRNISMPTPPSALSRSIASAQPIRKSSIPVMKLSTPEPAPTPAPAPRSLRHRASMFSLRPESRTASGRRSRSGLLPPDMAVDGHEADNESPAYHRRPGSALASGRRSAMMFSRAGNRPSFGSQERPRWRP